MPKGKTNEPKQGIHRETADNVLDQSQAEALLAQCRRDYVALAPVAVNIVERMLQGGPVDKDVFSAAVQVLKGTGVHGERMRARSDVRMTQDVSHETDEQLDKSIAEFLSPDQERKA